MIKNIGGFTGAKNFRSKSEAKRKEIQRKAAPLVKRETAVPGVQKTIGKMGMKRFLGGGKLGKLGKIKRKKA